ncbi:NAD(P)H-dependent oxidoreductase [Patulibacter brassicae]|uniref:NAD(P)H-dependent oxidoreductase n=1 Tax=Patulibacter brassicae TaxID=1705717 RepID=A0ABU4VI68_9ACTN|nr:NAD(P)H-dependent oxidoreductase [Patulibacter brassicae]MDX8151483.1 NAD(P)H-dependent oxidoreductase [Patulibacter brassicae]
MTPDVGAIAPTDHDPLRLGVVVGSTRPGRRADAVLDWVRPRAASRPALDVAVVDLADHDLPQLDEPAPARHGAPIHAHTRRLAAAVAPLDALLFLVPEYNHSLPGVLKTALDLLSDEWADRAAGLVTYGADAGGARAGEHLRAILGELAVATVQQQVGLSFVEHAPGGVLAPTARHEAQLGVLLDQLERWGGALRVLRRPAGVLA